MIKHYDYIIAGAGCAGLSLLARMMHQSFFNNKKILLVDKQQKNRNDRTWCFWEKENGFFENIVHHKWQQIDFYSNDYSARFDIEPYEYKMIRGIDLYDFVLNKIKQNANIEIVYADVQSIFSNESYAVLKTATDEFHADYIFNSILLYDWKTEALQKPNTYLLLQHFKGRLIETRENIFDERIATFMDFRVEQTYGTTFVYVLPVSKNKALIEYTLFTENLLGEEEYDKGLNDYIDQFLSIKKYSVLHEEFGVIPMTNFQFSKGDERIINIGTTGNQTKGSSGYTFQFIQKHSDKIIDAMLRNESPLIKPQLADKRFKLYDDILLNVLYNKKLSGDKLFARLFKKNPPQKIMKFLDNETPFSEELKIMNSVSITTFFPAAIKEILSMKF